MKRKISEPDEAEKDRYRISFWRVIGISFLSLLVVVFLGSVSGGIFFTWALVRWFAEICGASELGAVIITSTVTTALTVVASVANACSMVTSDIKRRAVSESMQEIRRIAGQESLTQPWMAGQFADYVEQRDLMTATYLRIKKHPACKAADEVQRAAKEKRVLQARCKTYEYQMQYLKKLHPEIESEIGHIPERRIEPDPVGRAVDRRRGIKRAVVIGLIIAAFICGAVTADTYLYDDARTFVVAYADGVVNAIATPAPTPTATPKATAQPKPTPKPSTRTGGGGGGGGGEFGEAISAVGYIGNTNTMKFHLPSCSYLPTEENQIVIMTRSEAIRAGYEPCGHCKP